MGVTINVTDVAEPPSAPSSPTVSAASSTSLQVTWDAPENTGPNITDYDYRYKALADSSWTEVTNTTITVTTVTIPGLTASTFYDVEVLAKNAEGASEWSNPGIGSTAAPGANSPPVFNEGVSATRSVSATAPTGASIGRARRGDGRRFGRHADLQPRRAGRGLVRHQHGKRPAHHDSGSHADRRGHARRSRSSANDGTDIARITVAIEATAAPPNNPPVFTEGASATRSVSEDAAAGVNIGSPVTATDPDQGDTLTYSAGRH